MEQINLSKMIVQAKLVVGYWEFIPMESWAEFLALQDTSTVSVLRLAAGVTWTVACARDAGSPKYHPTNAH